MSTTKQKNQQILTKSDHEIIKIVTKFFRQDKHKITNSIDMFRSIDKTLKNCLLCLSEMREEKYTEAFIILEYCLKFDKKAVDIIGE